MNDLGSDLNRVVFAEVQIGVPAGALHLHPVAVGAYGDAGTLGHITVEGIKPPDTVAVVIEDLLAALQIAKTFFAAVGHDHQTGVQPVFVLHQKAGG